MLPAFTSTRMIRANAVTFHQVTCQLEEGTLENVGDIFGGITCARWSPDLELLAVIAGNGQLLLMRENFDTVLEQILETEELGEKSAVTVGWGKR